MVSTRVKAYVKNNSATVDGWKNIILKQHLLVMLYKAHSENQYTYTSKAIVNSKGQHAILNDVMSEHYGLAHLRNISNWSADIVVYQAKFEELIKDLDEKPVFDIQSPEKTYEDDIYTDLPDLGLKHLAYIYHHQDEYDFRDKNRTHKRYGNLCLGVIPKDIKEDADQISFRNAIAERYSDKIYDVGTLFNGKPWEGFVTPKWEYDVMASYELGSYTKKVVPDEVYKIDLEDLDIRMATVRSGIETLNKTLNDLQDLKGIVEDAGGVEAFREKFFEKAIAKFVNEVPLHINDEKEDIKELALRASRKKYY